MKNQWNRSTVHRSGPQWLVHGSMETSLNQDRPSGVLRLAINEPMGIWSSNLAHWFRFGRRGRVFFFGSLEQDRAPGGAMADGMSELKLELRCMKWSKVSSYVVKATKGTRFVNLPRWKWTTGSWRQGGGLGGLQWWWGRHLVALRLQGLLR
jgi:hypothetical protein